MKYFNKNNSHFHGIMFHHFHDNKKHKKGQGSISRDKFVKIIKFIGLKNIISAHNFYEKFKKKKLKDNEVCLTFDDGLKCTYDIAYPVLEELKIKSFFFISTIPYENKTNLLEIYRYFRINYFKNINNFYKQFFNKCNNFELKRFLKINKKRIKEIKKTYTFYSIKDIEFRLVRNEFLSIAQYDFLMQKLFNEKKFDPQNCVKKIFMSKSDLLEMKNNDEIIGLHSHSHPNQMHKLTFDKQKKEFSINKENISKILKVDENEIKTMSHPSGNYNKDTLKILKELNINFGFRDNMFVEGRMKKINNSDLEISRSNHAEILKLIK